MPSEHAEKLYRLRAKDVAKADAVLATAFQNDPVWEMVRQPSA